MLYSRSRTAAVPARSSPPVMRRTVFRYSPGYGAIAGRSFMESRSFRRPRTIHQIGKPIPPRMMRAEVTRFIQTSPE